MTVNVNIAELNTTTIMKTGRMIIEVHLLHDMIRTSSTGDFFEIRNVTCWCSKPRCHRLLKSKKPNIRRGWAICFGKHILHITAWMRPKDCISKI